MSSDAWHSSGIRHELVVVFARLALGASFLSAVADRWGLWGPPGASQVAWGTFANFVDYTRIVTSALPIALPGLFAWLATVAEVLCGVALILGVELRLAAVLSGVLLLSFAMGMATGVHVKAPFDYSVFSAAAAALLLAFCPADRFAVDHLLRRPPTGSALANET